MNYLGKVFNNWKYFYGEINAATLTGAIDVVIVEQPDGSYSCSPFHVRFGKMGVLRSKEKIVDIEINGEPVDIHMKLGESGEAFFVEEVLEADVPPHLACSPIPPDDCGEETADVDRLDDEEQGGEKGGGGERKLEVEPVPCLTVTSTPKTFKAEKVEEETVLESTEFRPITGQNSSTSLSGLDTDCTKDDSPSADERQSANSVSNSSNSSKRKRRKKSTKKKNKEQMKRGSASGASLTVDEEGGSESIFQLDDLDSPSLVSSQVETLPIPDNTREEKSKPLDLSGVSHEGRDIHFFSDTEITPGSSPRDGCDFGPIQSDSEFETKRLVESEQRNGVDESSQSQWRWGELPTSGSMEDKKQESQKWMLQSMLGFMKKTKHMRHKNEAEGIYLSDLNSDDPEMAALYFPSPHRPNAPTLDYHEETREEDAESGNGPSLPQSPHSVEGAICGPKPSDSDDKCFPGDLALSICDPNPSPAQFEEGIVSYSEFVDNPQILSNPKLMVRFGGKYYSWKSAAPLLVSVLFFHKPLPQETLSRLSEGEVELRSENEELRSDVDKGKESKKSYSWWWSRNNPKYDVSKDGAAHPKDEEETKQAEMPTESDGANISVIDKSESLPKLPDDIPADIVNDQPLDLSPQNRQENAPAQQEEAQKEEDVGTPEFNSDKYRKTLRLSSDQIARLKLRPGANEIQFSVTTAYQGTSKCKCFLFSWRYDDKIVISDIDGTITKSDVLGHILPIVGKDWAQSGVAKLFTKIKDNGYKLLYLSARAIGQSRVTREYLKSIKQEDLGLPEGPMLLNPTSLLTAFHTEVIEKKPEEFKISCLRDIQALFPSNLKPFYAGYGNKINDVWAYQAVGIPIFRIFTINHRGELKHELTQTFQSSYTNMSTLVDQMFPPNKPQLSSEDFSEFNYWREPILNIEHELSSQAKS